MRLAIVEIDFPYEETRYGLVSDTSKVGDTVDMFTVVKEIVIDDLPRYQLDMALLELGVLAKGRIFRTVECAPSTESVKEKFWSQWRKSLLDWTSYCLQNGRYGKDLKEKLESADIETLKKVDKLCFTDKDQIAELLHVDKKEVHLAFQYGVIQYEDI